MGDPFRSFGLTAETRRQSFAPPGALTQITTVTAGVAPAATRPIATRPTAILSIAARALFSWHQFTGDTGHTGEEVLGRDRLQQANVHLYGD